MLFSFRKFAVTTAFTILTLSFSGCGSSETATTTPDDTEGSAVDLATAGARIQSSADALVLAINNSDVSAALSGTPFLIDGSSEDWDTYISEENSIYLTDIFGSAEEEPAVVTKIRVLLDEFSGTIGTIFTFDPELDCVIEGFDGLAPLTFSSTLDMAFYDDLDAGTEADPFYQCVFKEDSEEDGNTRTVYGQDASGVVRFIDAGFTESENGDDVEVRGDTQRLSQVKFVSYGETVENETDVAYLDLQYTQATVLNGPDDEFGTDDDMVFKSRSRIIGRTELDSEGSPVVSAGEFNIVKYDAGQNDSDEVYTVTSQFSGRGDFTPGGTFVMAVDSDAGSLADAAGTFCLSVPDAGGLPAVAESETCADLETGFAWGDAEFPFAIAPELSATFANNAFFNTDTDLIANDGSNFELPDYE